MDAASYRRECLFRHPTFREDLVGFYRRFPWVLRLWPNRPDHPSLNGVPEDIRRLIERRGARLIVLTPRTLEEVFRLLIYHPMFTPQYARCLFDYEQLNPQWKPDYFPELGTGETPETYREARQQLLQRWPSVPYDVLFFGQHDPPAHPSCIPKPTLLSRGMLREWQDEIIRLSAADELLGFIPYYTHTTRADVDAARRQLQTHEARRQTRTPPRRRRQDQYQRRLDVWDAYHNCGMFAPIARELGVSDSTIQGIYLQASRDILGIDSPRGRSRRTRLLQGFDPHTHTQTCGQCRTASRLEQMCVAAQAFARQDER
jgi:hypothetical protein